MPDTKNDFQVLLRLRQYRREIIGLVGLALFLWAYWSWLDYRKFLKTPLEFPESEKTLVVEKGANLHVLSSRWLERGILKNQLYFKIYLKLNPQLTRLKAGEYELSSKMSVSELLQLLNSGQVIQYSFTIIPGQNYYQVLQNLTLQNNLEPLSTGSSEAPWARGAPDAGAPKVMTAVSDLCFDHPLVHHLYTVRAPVARWSLV